MITNDYELIETYAGMTIDSAVEELLEQNALRKKSYIDFNGHILYSDKVTLDSAYIEITGKTKEEHERSEAEQREAYREKEKRWLEKIPEMTEKWIASGHEILDKQYWDFWDMIVPIRLKDLYHGAELPQCLEIVMLLNKGCSMEVTMSVLENQGHSYMSFHLVRDMVKHLCDRGLEFSDYVIEKE